MANEPVHDLPSLPVEYPPKGEGCLLSPSRQTFVARKSVTFDVDADSGDEADKHLPIRRSISAESPRTSPIHRGMRRRSKSVLRIRQAPSYILSVGSVDDRRKVFAESRPATGKDDGIVDDGVNDDDDNNFSTDEPATRIKGGRRGSFFQTFEHQLQTARHSLSPQSTSPPERVFMTPLVQVLSQLRSTRTKCYQLQEECLTNPAFDQKDDQVSNVMAKMECYVSEIELQLDRCIDQLENLDSTKTSGQIVQKQFQTFLTQQSNEPDSELDPQFAFWMSQMFSTKEADIDEAVLMEPSISHHLMKNASFSDEGNLYGMPLPNEHEVTEFFDGIDAWGMDVFHLSDITSGHPLVTTACAIFRKRNLWKIAKLHQTKFINFMNEIESKYHIENPYHNSLHGADVMQTTHTLLNLAAFEGSFMPLEIVSLLVAAAVHDVDHPGRTNEFLIATGNELAILYHDESVLECHHLAVTFSILKRPECDFMSCLADHQQKAFRRIVTDMVMATDMAQHFKHVGTMKSMLETKMETSREITVEAYEDRVEIMKYMIHSADLSNPAKPLDLSKKWSLQISEELFMQGDEIKELGQEVPIINDREKANISKNQLNFFDYFIYPLFEVLTDLVYPSGDFILSYLNTNKQYWKAQDKASKLDMIKDCYVPTAVKKRVVASKDENKDIDQ